MLDVDGVELKDLGMAHAHALEIIRDMMAMFPDAEDWRGWRIEITDTDWRTLLIVLFPDHASSLPARPQRQLGFQAKKST